MHAGDHFPIGVLAKHSGINIETIRYYERVGLLPKVARSESGYRQYRPPDADRLRFVRRARDLGFSLDDVRRLLDLSDRRSKSCRRVQDIANQHLVEVRAKMADLARMEKVLATLVSACAEGTMPDCPLLETLAKSA